MSLGERSPAATSCRLGVNKMKFSRLTSVTSMSLRRASLLSRYLAAYNPANPPPAITTLVCLIVRFINHYQSAIAPIDRQRALPLPHRGLRYGSTPLSLPVGPASSGPVRFCRRLPFHCSRLGHWNETGAWCARTSIPTRCNAAFLL